VTTDTSTPNLARALLPSASQDQVDQWSDALDAGPYLDEEKLTEVAERWRLQNETLDGSKARYRELWRLNLLSGIGRDNLPAPYASELNVLEQRYGVVEHAEFPAYSTSWVGPTSPVTEEGLAAYGVAELVEYLRTWRPQRPEPWDPSKEGLGRALQAAVAKRSE
jgi:hypothetical protein